MNALAIVTLVNALIQTFTQLGLGWAEVGAMVAKAKSDGREFGLQDLQVLHDKARVALDALGASIAQAQIAKPVGPTDPVAAALVAIKAASAHP